MTQTKHKHLGFSEQERETSPYASFFNPRMAPLPEHVRDALVIGAVAHELLPPITRACEMQRSEYALVETGYTVCPDGAARVGVLTRMPGVTPAMWEWWFAWHGSDAQRYKLWHPLAHVDVGWEDGRDDLDGYVGRVSNVTEYVGATLLELSIHFVEPSTIGLDESLLKKNGESAICARVGMVIGGATVESGWLLHHIRPVSGGSEMRSRFWLGGSNVRLFGIQGSMGEFLGRVASRLQALSLNQITELVVHDAQEMNHLAAILPELYATFGELRSNEQKAGSRK